jgi:hypothetical protein
MPMRATLERVSAISDRDRRPGPPIEGEPNPVEKAMIADTGDVHAAGNAGQSGNDLATVRARKKHLALGFR